ncbi:hypothetical protein B0J17DRAFT_723191 [Rhizoctonia solani]|nr:hypothetical protein B0J17DRAFT_723191 [Rhizoctonia solani]
MAVGPKAIGASSAGLLEVTPFRRFVAQTYVWLAGKSGLQNKCEIYCISPALSKIPRAVRKFLKLQSNDPKRLFEGKALIRRLVRIGVLDKARMHVD